MKFLKNIASSNNAGNFSSKLRRKRFNLFQQYIEKSELKNPKIVDVGGTKVYWEQINNYFNSSYSPVIINISKNELLESNYSGIVGDGKFLSFIKDNIFDIAYSNSVIEHLLTFEEQIEMTKNIRRVAKYYFIQTPAFIFPLEPHFLFPFFHWLPKKIRIWLVTHFNLGWFKKCVNKNDAEILVNSIRIVMKNELKILFSGAQILTEKFLMIPKSYLITNMNNK